MTAREVALEVGRSRGVRREDLLGGSRSAPAVAARYEAMYRCRSELGLSYPQIGRAFGRDHSTVLYGIRRHRALLRGLPPEPVEDRCRDAQIIREQARQIAEMARTIEGLLLRLASRQGELFAGGAV